MTARCASSSSASAEALSDLVGRLVIRWASPRAWWVNGTTGQKYPVIEVADA